MMLEENLLANRVFGFGIVTLSSGESEFYGGVTGVCDAKHILDILKFNGFKVKMPLEIDASASIGVCTRLGVGTLRHIEAKTLWIQKLAQDGELVVKKIGTKENTADLGTKILDGPRIKELADKIDFMEIPVESKASGASGTRGVVNALRMLSSMLLPAGVAGQYQVVKVPVVGEMFDIPVNIYWQPTLGELLLVIAALLTIACMFGCYIGWCCRNRFPSKESLSRRRKAQIRMRQRTRRVR